MVTLDQPTLPDEKSAPTFRYSYRVLRKAKKEQATVIVIPGGPGITTLDQANNYAVSIPANFGVILTDPRGVGCNQERKGEQLFPNSFFQSESVASDILSIVTHERLKKYILYGESYGTLVATIAAAKAETLGMQKPMALLLVGVLGRTLPATHHMLAYWKKFKTWGKNEVPNFSAVLDLALDRLSDERLFTRYQASLILQSFILLGYAQKTNRYSLLDLLIVLNHTPDEPLYKPYYDLILGTSFKASPKAFRFRQRIACSELFKTDYAIQFQNKDLILNKKENTCQNFKLGNKAFDSKKWLSTAPIYYFQGADDPVIPQSQAFYHFSQQKTRRKLFVFQQGSHSPLTQNSCILPVFSAVVKDAESAAPLGSEAIEGALMKCGSNSFKVLKADAGKANAEVDALVQRAVNNKEFDL